MFAAQVTIVDRNAACNLHECHHKCLYIAYQEFLVTLNQVNAVRHKLYYVCQEVYQVRGRLGHPSLFA